MPDMHNLRFPEVLNAKFQVSGFLGFRFKTLTHKRIYGRLIDRKNGGVQLRKS
jgi:hypothetical protein